jgi:hypothetical protein
MIIRKAAVVLATAVLAALGAAPSASAVTIIDWTAWVLIQEGLVAPVTIPCGGERIDLKGRVAVHVLVHDDETLDYHINAMGASGVGAATGITYRLVGAATGAARSGELLRADLSLQANSAERLPVEVGVRMSAGTSRGKPNLSLASIRIVPFCDPGTITMSDASVGGFGDYTIQLIGTALKPNSGVPVFGVAARGAVPFAELLATLPVEADGTVSEYLYPRCSFGFVYYYATGTSASGMPVMSNTYYPPC